jgi:hypothetical protein
VDTASISDDLFLGSARVRPVGRPASLALAAAGRPQADRVGLVFFKISLYLTVAVRLLRGVVGLNFLFI